MHMQTRISSRDVVLLSEYLDGRLDQNQRLRLEARLKASPELRSLMEDLRRTRIILRSSPRVCAPRSFKLTPQMAGIKPARRIYPVFQFASALAGLFLVVILAMDFLVFGAMRLAKQPMQLAKEAMPLVTQIEKVEAAAPPTEAAAEAPPSSAEDKAVEVLTAPANETQPPAPVSKAGVAVTLGITTTQEFTATTPITEEVFLANVETPTPIAEANVPRDTIQIAAAPTGEGEMVVLAEPGQLKSEPSFSSWSIFRVVEIAVVVVLVGLVLAAILLRRKERRYL